MMFAGSLIVGAALAFIGTALGRARPLARRTRLLVFVVLAAGTSLMMIGAGR